MSQFIINRNNMQDVREMCAFFAKEHKYEIERLAWQRGVLEKKEFHFFCVRFERGNKAVRKIEQELMLWHSDAKARYNHMIDAYHMCLLVEALTSEHLFEEMHVNSVDMGIVVDYFRIYALVGHVVYDDDFILY